MATRRRRIPGPAQRVGGPALWEPRPRRQKRWNPQPGAQAVARAQGVPQPNPLWWERMRAAQAPGSVTNAGVAPGAPAAPPGLAAPGAPAPGVAFATNPAYIQGVRGLEDQLAAMLSGITGQRGLLDPQRQLTRTRLGIEETEDTRLLNEGMNTRGIYNSGIRPTEQGKLTQQYGQRYEDVEFAHAQQLAALAQQEAAARATYQSGLGELLLGLAGPMSEDTGLGAFADQMSEETRPQAQAGGQVNEPHGPERAGNRVKHHGEWHTRRHQHVHKH
jgi:hypothetical protein